MQMKSLIVFSHLCWVFVLERPQHLLPRLARTWRVLFVVEPDSILASRAPSCAHGTTRVAAKSA